MAKITKEIDCIIFERTACFGACPVYRAVVHSNGLVEYWGIEYVARKGYYRWKIEPEKVDQVTELAEKIIQLMNRYENQIQQGKKRREIWTDNPWCIITVNYKDGSIRYVEHYHGEVSAPKRLKTMENRIDRIIHTDRFVGTKQ